MLALAAFKLMDWSDPPASAASVFGIISVYIVAGLSCPHFHSFFTYNIDSGLNL